MELDRQKFGHIELQRDTRRVYVGGRPVSLGARATDILFALSDCRGQLLSRSELLDLVWPDVAVEENNLTVQVAALRKALGSDVITTVPGRGYRFALQGDDDVPIVAEPPPLTHPRQANTLDPLIGRESELAALKAKLEQHRVVTVIGAGGVGKTRLAQQVLTNHGETLSHGVAWVDAGSLADESQLLGATAYALGLSLGSGDPLDSLLTAAGPLEVLLVIDSAERLAEAIGRMLSALLPAAPRVRVLATSQVPLRIPLEALLRLKSLDVPSRAVSPERAVSYGAVALFCQLASAADHRFTIDGGNVAAIVDICRTLGGMPLALQLAAARFRHFSSADLARALPQQPWLLNTGRRLAPARQHSLRAALEWSHDLLDAESAKVFRRLAVFSGGFTLAMGQGVAIDDDATTDEWQVQDIFHDLIDRSLVVVDEREPPRYRLLDPMQALASEKLAASPDQAACRRRHAYVVLAQLEQLDEIRPGGGPSSDVAFELMTDELGNIYRALEWAKEHDPDAAIRLAALSQVPLADRSRQQECDVWEAVAGLYDERLPAPTKALWALYSLKVWRGRRSALAHEWGQRAVDAYEALGDPLHMYVALCYLVLADRLAVGTVQRRALARLVELERTEWPPGVRRYGALSQLAIARNDGALEIAVDALDRAFALSVAAGSRRGAMRTLVRLAEVELMLGRVEDARAHCEEAVAQLRAPRAGLADFAIGLLNLAAIQLEQDDRAAARATAQEGWPLAAAFDLCNPWGDYLALLAALEGECETAARLLGYADGFYERRNGERQANEANAVQRVERLCRAGMSEARWTALRAEGQTLREEQVGEFVRGETLH
jgi:predicted ATPase/DNA-binding winged helix-turn-helix (wHTH) protein